ncbi:ABC transporter permease [Paenibacillus durus]|uniref:ABC-2 type transporter transmembrane domain-containing protein n=1 Tax=Paenibacillus durus ATCC 35681 TaxID=1333534 RepID=A0A0F7F6K0_PAEDU|nr:ABC transporter permease [Paenibacillus durus]AKG33419.1 hypothetical protein VK70_01350 [Paenibacillus durus ATCC 35681]
MSTGAQIMKLFVAQLKTMFREKAVWFWNLFFPVILMVLFMVIFGGGGDGGDFKAKVALVNPAPSASSDSLEAGLRKIPVFEWKSEQAVDSAQADAWVKDKDVDAAIVLPENGNSGDIKLKPVTQVLPLTYFVEGMRDGMVYGSGLFSSSFWFGIGILALWGVAAFSIGALIYRKGKVEVR